MRDTYFKERSNGFKFIDLFAGAGGLSEGFVRAGFEPLAHVEADSSAAYTLRTRQSYHNLMKSDQLRVYERYISGRIKREKLYETAFSEFPCNVVEQEISQGNLKSIFKQLDSILAGQKPDLIIGGPPCQAYSLVGRSRSHLGMLGDDRNFLYQYYAMFLKKFKPRYFVFENVVGLLSARDKDGERYLDKMLLLFKEVGYHVEYQTISSDRYGVLQKRRRVILVGRRGKKHNHFPDLQEWVPDATVSDAIADLPSLQAGEGSILPTKRRSGSEWLSEAGIAKGNKSVTWHQARPHNPRDLEIFGYAVDRWDKDAVRLDYNELPERLKTHKNRSSFLDRFKVVSSNTPTSHTIVAHISKDGNYYIHPDRSQNRSLTPREAARIQTFPDDYFFESTSGKPSRTAAFKQIGNAVPVLLAHAIAQALKEQWS